MILSLIIPFSTAALTSFNINDDASLADLPAPSLVPDSTFDATFEDPTKIDSMDGNTAEIHEIKANSLCLNNDTSFCNVADSEQYANGVVLLPVFYDDETDTKINLDVTSIQLAEDCHVELFAPNLLAPNGEMSNTFYSNMTTLPTGYSGFVTKMILSCQPTMDAICFYTGVNYGYNEQCFSQFTDMAIDPNNSNRFIYSFTGNSTDLDQKIGTKFAAASVFIHDPDCKNLTMFSGDNWDGESWSVSESSSNISETVGLGESYNRKMKSFKLDCEFESNFQ